jgi:hypothetical protein
MIKNKEEFTENLNKFLETREKKICEYLTKRHEGIQRES